MKQRADRGDTRFLHFQSSSFTFTSQSENPLLQALAALLTSLSPPRHRAQTSPPRLFVFQTAAALNPPPPIVRSLSSKSVSVCSSICCHRGSSSSRQIVHPQSAIFILQGESFLMDLHLRATDLSVCCLYAMDLSISLRFSRFFTLCAMDLSVCCLL